MKTIKKYKGINLKYNEQDGCIYFNFESKERKTKYVFEAEQIIDEPIWEDCQIEGYFIDGYTDRFIGLAKAKRKNIKTDEPDWYFKRQYDSEFKKLDSISEIEVFPKTKENEVIYKQWENQREIYINELRKLNKITEDLNK